MCMYEIKLARLDQTMESSLYKTLLTRSALVLCNVHAMSALTMHYVFEAYSEISHERITNKAPARNS